MTFPTTSPEARPIMTQPPSNPRTPSDADGASADLVAVLRDASMRARLNRSNRALVSEDILASAADELEALTAQLLNAGGTWGGDAVDTGVPAVQALVPRTPLSDIEGRLAKLEAASAALDAEVDDQSELLDTMEAIAREEGLDWDRHRGLLVEKAQARMAELPDDLFDAPRAEPACPSTDGMPCCVACYHAGTCVR